MSHGPFHQEERIVTTRPFVDTLGRAVQIFHAPQRLVSLVPISLKCSLVLVGGNRWWGLPTTVRNWPVVATKTKIGGTKNPDIATILALRPELVFAGRRKPSPGCRAACHRWGAGYVFAPHTVRDGIDLLWRVADLWIVDLR